VLAIQVVASKVEPLVVGASKCVLEPVDDFSAETGHVIVYRSSIHCKLSVPSDGVALMPETIVTLTERSKKFSNKFARNYINTIRIN